jgi:5-methylcytosine-specific restriction protein A
VPEATQRGWLRDEAILALDLYVREGVSPGIVAIRALSATLRALPLERRNSDTERFRSEGSVKFKLGNFAALDEEASQAGLTNASATDRQLWSEHSDGILDVRATADAIRANTAAIARDPATVPPPLATIEEAPEGQLLTRVHQVRERNSKLTDGHKKAVLAETGKLACEGCGFDFVAVYGDRGHGFIECHHTVPVSSLEPGAKTRRADLALVCANCHRMIHRRAPWLSMDELRALTTVR